jgi:transposase
MTIVAYSHLFVVGVDTHARKHVSPSLPQQAANGSKTGISRRRAPGFNRASAWVARRTEADLATLWVIEGAASYGAVLAGAVAAAGYQVAEATRMDALSRRGVGKSDPLDAHRIASAVLSLEEDRLRRPRLNEGVRAALRVLVTARHSMTTYRTRTVNALTALLRSMIWVWTRVSR